ncbi:MAG: RHS repeat-associated core domain-containing protein [Bacteroidales bacterium]|nr:RHS repeat-associated core domain-containing protein [Bacteroidales bacterium]
MPQTVTQSGTTKATYGWFADGSKYSVQDAQGNGYCYIGSLIYSTTAGAAVLESIDFSGGRIVLSGNTKTIHYHHKDHLGSVRAITDGSGSTIEQNAYYPFGGRHTFGQTYAQTTANRYKFNGKELQTIGGLDLLDYGARMYDTKIARWLVQDPLAEKYYPFSAYNYCVNNPVRFVDKDGKFVESGKEFEKRAYGIDISLHNYKKYYSEKFLVPHIKYNEYVKRF